MLTEVGSSSRQQRPREPGRPAQLAGGDNRVAVPLKTPGSAVPMTVSCGQRDEHASPFRIAYPTDRFASATSSFPTPAFILYSDVSRNQALCHCAGRSMETYRRSQTEIRQ